MWEALKMWSRMRYRAQPSGNCSVVQRLLHFVISQCSNARILSYAGHRKGRKEKDLFSLYIGVLHCRSRFECKRKVVLQVSPVLTLFDYNRTSPLGGHLDVVTTIQKTRGNSIWKGIRVLVVATLCAGWINQPKALISDCWSQKFPPPPHSVLSETFYWLCRHVFPE